MATNATDPEPRQRFVLGLDSAGVLMTPEEFDAVTDYDKNYCYELIRGIVVVSPIPPPEVRGPNELLGYYLFRYHEAQGAGVTLTLPQHYICVAHGRRIANRVFWCGDNDDIDPYRDPANIAVDFVSEDRRNRKRNYEEKLDEYERAGLDEYWIIDRFERTLTVVQYRGQKPVVRTYKEHEKYESSLLPGFVVPLQKLLQAADRLARTKH